jgi:hypothetical protein
MDGIYEIEACVATVKTVGQLVGAVMVTGIRYWVVE